MAPMLTSGQKPSAEMREETSLDSAQRAPIINSFPSTPPDVPEPSDITQIADFTRSTPGKY